MGEHHARFYASQADVELVGVVDALPERAELAARRFGCKAYGSVAEMLSTSRPDLASVAVPANLHASATLELLAAGVHVLVEKPLAASSADAERIVAAAASSDRVVAVGHVERFNPAVEALVSRLDQAGPLISLSFTRIGPYPGRIRDTGVTIDLATHDLDLARVILRAEPLAVFAVTRGVVRPEAGLDDSLIATLEFPGAIAVGLDVNWISPTKTRAIGVVGERGRFEVDLMRQQVRFYEGAITPATWRELQDLAVGTGEGMMIRYALEHREPLAVELRAFIDAIGGHGRVVTPVEAARSLFVAEIVRKSGEARARLEIAGLDHAISAPASAAGATTPAR